jgi:hypothetical protein
MSIQWPPELVSAIARRRCVVVLGSGISRQCVNAGGQRPPTWEQLLNKGVNRLTASAAIKTAIGKVVRSREYLLACQLVKEQMGDPEFHDYLREQFLVPQFQPAAIHDSVIRLDSRIVATPNFDKIFDTRINTVQNNSVPIKCYYDVDLAQAIRSRGRLVIKIHGTIDTAARTIFTRQEYAAARQANADFYAVLEALILTHTFLFLGCGLSDPDVQLLLEDYSNKFRHTAPHFFVLPKNYYSHSSVLTSVARSLNIRLLSYDPRNDHAALCPAIDDLCQLVDQERQDLQKSADW